MELTAKTLQEVTFGSSKVRGYNPAEVDQFIEAVAEGVEELRERLRRAVERATRAEQAVAQAAANPPVDTGAPPAGQPEISKVWERAVAAAESAVAEAKAEAEQLVGEARREAEARTTSANHEADSRLYNARQESESMVSKAQTEAVRISEESQAQLRKDIAQLETVRDGLKADVDGLQSFLAAEKERLSTTLNAALEALRNYSSDSNNAPKLSEPQLPDVLTASAFSSITSSSSESVYSSEPPVPPVYAPPEVSSDQSWQAPAAPLDVPQYSSEAVTPEIEQQPWGQSEWTASEEPSEKSSDQNNGWGASSSDPSWGEAISGEPEPPQISWGGTESSSDNPPSSEEDGDESNPQEAQDEGGDPFLAELRKAVQDDGPLGPREEENGDGGSIDSLYSNEDEDRSGFFRRKK